MIWETLTNKLEWPTILSWFFRTNTSALHFTSPPPGGRGYDKSRPTINSTPPQTPHQRRIMNIFSTPGNLKILEEELLFETKFKISYSFAIRNDFELKESVKNRTHIFIKQYKYLHNYIIFQRLSEWCITKDQYMVEAKNKPQRTLTFTLRWTQYIYRIPSFFFFSAHSIFIF